MRLFPFLIIIFLVFGCELIVDVDIPEHKPLITVNSLFNADSAWRFQINQSRGILENDMYRPIENATVRILEDGELIEELRANTLGSYRSEKNIKPQLGRKYEIEVSAPGFETVYAEGTLPQATQIKSATFERKRGGLFGNYNFQIDFTFTDPANEENYYEIMVTKRAWYIHPETQDTVVYYHYVYVYSDDKSVTSGDIEEILISDKFDDGQDHVIRLRGNDPMLDSNADEEYALSVISLSKDVYEYRLSSALQEYTSGDPFAQPVHVKNNIQNGLGIFGGTNRAMLLIKP